MPRYEVVLFDADHTLFDFDRAEREALRQTLGKANAATLRRTLEEAGLPADGETEARYLSINRALWNRLDRGEVRREWLVVERFAALLRALGRTGDAAALNRAYLDHLGEGSYLLPGAQALCRALAPRCTLAIVTNGVARAQRRRFEASPLNGLIPWLFISEELGASKPDSAFFAPVLRTLGNPDPRRVLMVGDNLLADIQGGIQAGLDTAWYNPGRLPGAPAIVPTWEVDGYAALQALILKEEKNNI